MPLLDSTNLQELAADRHIQSDHANTIFGFAGLAEETFFFRELLDNLHAKPYPYLRAEFKNMYNHLTHNGYNRPHKEATQAWLNSCMKQVIGDVVAARGLSHKQVSFTHRAVPFGSLYLIET